MGLLLAVIAAVILAVVAFKLLVAGLGALIAGLIAFVILIGIPWAYSAHGPGPGRVP